MISIFKSHFGCFDGMENLGSGVTAKIADTVGLLVHRMSELFCSKLLRVKRLCLKMVVLTVKTIKPAGMIEYGQILITVFSAFDSRIFGISAARTSRADKVPHTVGRKGIIIVGQVPLMWSPSGNSTVLNPSKSTKANAVFRNPTIMDTQPTGNAVHCIRGILRKAIGPTAAIMNGLDLRPDIVEMRPDTAGAKADGVGYVFCAFIAGITFTHNNLNYN
jgi:hypothetical protein